MTLIEHNEEFLIFELHRREKQVLTAILQLYPLLNPDYHQITRQEANDRRLEESQMLLREAMAQQRKENKARVATFLSDANWEKRESRYRVKIPTEDIEWLLQVLNDVRVGSWVILGKPDHEKGEKAEVTGDNLQYAGALELSGYFQMALMQAMEQ